MDATYFLLIYLIYGLAFFSMGLAVILEWGRGSDVRLRLALRPLAAFGLLHGMHEWLEIFERLQLLPGEVRVPWAWSGLRLALLSFSFLSLAAFGASLLSPTERRRRLSLLVPLTMAAIWGLGLLVLRGQYSLENHLLEVADVWSRYVLAIPAALLASLGLVAQQRAFRQAGLIRFGRDSLWAAVAFAWYGIIGQTFVRASPLPPSNFFNQDLFLQVFGFPVQLLRAAAAVVTAIFVIRFLRSFEVETRRQIAELQAARLEEAQRREALRGELLRRVVTAQEAERQRVARELHDATGQALTALGLGLRGVQNSCQRQDLDQVERNLRRLEELTANSLDELRHLIADLRPPHLDDLGLPAALRWYTKELQGRVPLAVHVELIGQEQLLSPPIKIALFRVAQEALTNVIKYSGAEHAWVRLSYNEHEVDLQVEDNGCGFDPAVQAMSNRSSWGLLGMRERATLLGGRFELFSQPGYGTRVQVVIPYQQVETEEAHDDSLAAG
jgi:signal transduction histidine kinase